MGLGSGTTVAVGRVVGSCVGFAGVSVGDEVAVGSGVGLVVLVGVGSDVTVGDAVGSIVGDGITVTVGSGDVGSVGFGEAVIVGVGRITGPSGESGAPGAAPSDVKMAVIDATINLRSDSSSRRFACSSIDCQNITAGFFIDLHSLGDSCVTHSQHSSGRRRAYTVKSPERCLCVELVKTRRLLGFLEVRTSV